MPHDGEAELSFAHRITMSDKALEEPVLAFIDEYIKAAYQKECADLIRLKRLLACI